jgi:DNA invertase Pin-like site-specific DNA recombinase
MKLGYARISISDQTSDSQVSLLQEAGYSKIFTDTISSSKMERKGLKESLEYTQAVDSIV